MCAGRAWVYADAKGTYNEETALRDNRRPILRVSGDTLEVLSSDDKFMRMHVSKRDPRLMVMEGDMGEFYTLSPAPGKVRRPPCSEQNPRLAVLRAGPSCTLTYLHHFQ